MNGTTMWAGLRAAQGSAEVWARLVDGPDTLEIGVFVPSKDLVVNPATEFCVVDNCNLPIRAIFLGTNHPDASKELFFLPPTYEVCLKFFLTTIYTYQNNTPRSSSRKRHGLSTVMASKDKVLAEGFTMMNFTFRFHKERDLTTLIILQQ